MTDTLFAKAKKIGNLKLQCAALAFRVNYYHNQKDYVNARKEFKRITPFLLRTPYVQYYFNTWGMLILEDINRKRYDEALVELNKFQIEARKRKSPYGIAYGYRLRGDMYYMQQAYRLALPQYKQALEYGIKYNFNDVYFLYRRLGDCCFHLHRWHKSELALLKSIELAPNLQLTLTGHFLLLSLYCCQDVQDKGKIDRTYTEIRRLLMLYPLINNQSNLYNESMYYYYTYYKKDAERAQAYLNMPDNMFRPDSLTYYYKKGLMQEMRGNEEQAAICYQNFCRIASNIQIQSDKAFLDSYVPQLDYQRVTHEKELLMQTTAKMKLERLRDVERLMKLESEHESLYLLDREKEHTILQNKLIAQKMTMKQQQQNILNQRLIATQQRHTVELQHDRAFWEILFGIIVVIVVIVSILLYLYGRRRVQKKLKDERLKAENSKQMKSLFFQNMNHEIRSPLNAILGFNDMLNGDMADSILPEQKEEFVKMISTNCQLLHTLVNDVLDLSNFESGSYKLNPADVDIRHLCRTVLESIRGRQNENVRLILKTTPETSYILHTDAQRLQQVLTNYLSNACKYTEEGSITLSYEVLPDVVRFAVSDTGCGVKPEDAEKVFERFQMLDKAKRGTGLGLHICRLIAKLLHARAYVDKSYTGGARFVFDHPLKVILSFFIALCCSFLPADAQHNNLEMRDNNYQYYLKMDTKLNEDIGSRMADTLFVMSQRTNDVSGMCYALENKVRYARYTDQETLLISAFNRLKAFCVKKRFYNPIFSSWTYVVNFYLRHSRFSDALKQLVDFQSFSSKVKMKNGISNYFYCAGNYYFSQWQFATASSYYLQTINYGDNDKYSTYTMLGQCQYNLHNYRNAIKFLNIALDNSINDVMKIAPSLYLLKSYCMLGDSKNATLLYEQVEKYNREKPKWMNESNYYSGLYLYYLLIKKDKIKAREVQPKIGNYGQPTNMADYYLELKDYNKACNLYKKIALKYLNWMRTNPSVLLESYTSNFDYGQAMKERDGLAMYNLQLDLIDAGNNRRFLQLTRDKTALQIAQAEKSMKQEKGELALQRLTLLQQKENMEKNKTLNAGIKKQKELREARQRIRMLTIIFLVLILCSIGAFIKYWLHQHEKRLRKEMLDAQVEERAKDRFFQNINNKIKRPLNTIVTLNEKLNMKGGSEMSGQQRTFMMQQLNDSGKYLSLLVNEVLDISKMESGTYKLRLQEVDIRLLCLSVIGEITEQAASGVKVLFDAKSASDIDADSFRLVSDMQRLHFVLKAYMENACQHTSEGSITLQYEVLPDKVVFCVTDTGEGISPELIHLVFNSEQIDVNRDNVGLSLHIVKLIANLLHGEAWVDMSYIEGARFYFMHPIGELQLPISADV
jgi:signal transduction histidine kinase